MAFVRHTHHNGGREGWLEQRRQAPVGQLRLTIAWMILTARQWLDRIIKPDATEHVGFTQLGASDLQRRHAAAMAPCPFPESNEQRARRARSSDDVR